MQALRLRVPQRTASNQWNDQSGHGHHATRQPRAQFVGYKASIQNGGLRSVSPRQAAHISANNYVGELGHMLGRVQGMQNAKTWRADIGRLLHASRMPDIDLIPRQMQRAPGYQNKFFGSSDDSGLREGPSTWNGTSGALRGVMICRDSGKYRVGDCRVRVELF